MHTAIIDVPMQSWISVCSLTWNGVLLVRREWWISRMAETSNDRLGPLRQLVEATDDSQVLELLNSTVQVLEEDTARLLDQTHIARDIAARTKAGDWFGNTELGEILQDADHFLRLYKRQREGLAELKSLLRSRVVKS